VEKLRKARSSCRDKKKRKRRWKKNQSKFKSPDCPFSDLSDGAPLSFSNALSIAYLPNLPTYLHTYLHGLSTRSTPPCTSHPFSFFSHRDRTLSRFCARSSKRCLIHALITPHRRRNMDKFFFFCPVREFPRAQMIYSPHLDCEKQTTTTTTERNRGCRNARRRVFFFGGFMLHSCPIIPSYYGPN